MSNKIREIGYVLNATARLNKYRLSFAYPTGVSGTTNLQHVDIICKSAEAPGKTLGTIDLWNQGRKLVIPGDTAFDNAWAVSFYLDEAHKLRIDMVKWQEACDHFHRNKHAGLPGSIFSDLRLEQLDSADNVSAQYTLHNCFPTEIGTIAYADESSDSPGEFDITFSYTDWIVGKGEESDLTPMTPTLNPTSFDA